MNRLILLALVVIAVEASYMPWIRRNAVPKSEMKLHQRQAAPAEWFVQRLDHFNGQDSRTWKQRYFVNTEFWNGKGPIFLQVGGEAAIDSSAVYAWEYVNFAETYGAVCIAVEHRFYGESNPLSNYSTENFQFLSSEQALADLANFITTWKQDNNAMDSPVVTFGGSYPGNLAAWFRSKFPHLTVGSIASSAPVQATLDFFQYLDVVDKSLSFFSGAQCDAAIQEATSALATMINNKQLQQIETMFSTCTPIKSQNDIATLLSNLMGNFMDSVQYDVNVAINIQTMCATMLDTSSNALANYAKVNEMWLQINGQNCTQVSYTQMIQQLQNLTIDPISVSARSWTYQTCNEFGYFQTTDNAYQPFGSMVPLSYYLQICSDLGWNMNVSAQVEQTNANYGGNQNGGTNIMFVNGSIDPWHALSITTDEGNGIQAILINGTSHCADMYPGAEVPGFPQIAAAQTIIEKQVGLYLTA